MPLPRAPAPWPRASASGPLESSLALAWAPQLFWALQLVAPLLAPVVSPQHAAVYDGAPDNPPDTAHWSDHYRTWKMSIRKAHNT